MSEIAQVVALQKRVDEIMEIVGEDLASEVYACSEHIENFGLGLYSNLPARGKIYFRAIARRWLCRLLAELQDKGYEW